MDHRGRSTGIQPEGTSTMTVKIHTMTPANGEWRVTTLGREDFDILGAFEMTVEFNKVHSFVATEYGVLAVTLTELWDQGRYVTGECEDGQGVPERYTLHEDREAAVEQAQRHLLATVQRFTRRADDPELVGHTLTTKVSFDRPTSGQAEIVHDIDACPRCAEIGWNLTTETADAPASV